MGERGLIIADHDVGGNRSKRPPHVKTQPSEHRPERQAFACATPSHRGAGAAPLHVRCSSRGERPYAHDTRTSRFETPGHRRTGELPERIRPHPPCRRVLRICQTLRHYRGRGIECAIAFADRAQGHVRSRRDEMAFVSGFAFDEGETLLKRVRRGQTCRVR